MKIVLSTNEAQEFIRSHFPVSVDTVQIDATPLNPVQVQGVTPYLLHDMVSGRDGNNKILAIKALRAMTGWGLKDSKDVVEALWGRY